MAIDQLYSMNYLNLKKSAVAKAVIKVVNSAAANILRRIVYAGVVNNKLKYYNKY